MIRAWVRPPHHEWISGWLIGPVHTGQNTKVLVCYGIADQGNDLGMHLATVELHECRPMRTEIDFLPDAAKV
jgi:hypothetical protein